MFTLEQICYMCYALIFVYCSFNGSMAHLHLEDPSDEMTCPYDDTHRVRVSRFQYHLIKCGKVLNTFTLSYFLPSKMVFLRC
jgi:hypothetical protein